LQKQTWNVDKDGFIGQEAVLQQREKGPSTALVYLELDARDSDVCGGEPVFVNGKYAGITTSGGYGFTTRKSLAFAYIGPEMSGPGGNMEILILGERCKARILAEPVWDPKNERLRA